MTAFLLNDSTFAQLDAVYRAAAFAEGDDTEPGFDSHAAYFRAATAEALRVRDAYAAHLLASLEADAATYGADELAVDVDYRLWCEADAEAFDRYVTTAAGAAAEDARELEFAARTAA